MKIEIEAKDTKRAKVNANGTIYGLKKYVGREVLVIIPEEE